MKKLLFGFIAITILLVFAQLAFADETTGLAFLAANQDATGAITHGFSNPSQWAAIAFSASGVSIDTVKNPSISLRDFLLTHPPANTAPVSDWETALLAIVAAANDPTNFGGVNYVSHIESAYNNQQIGETYLLNDDMFGLLALIASGSSASATIKQDTLNFILNHQATNGGFSWSPDTTCQYCDTSDDMTAAAIQALQVAKENGLSYTGSNALTLDESITRARDYLLNSQNTDGGFGYFGTSDADTTSWALMALNVLSLGSSQQATSAKNWLLSHQSASGGFASYSGDDTTTTSHAVIALLGKGWLLHTFVIPSITPTVSVTMTPSPIPSATPTPTPTAPVVPTITPTPTIVPTATSVPSVVSGSAPTSTTSPTSTQKITEVASRNVFPSPTLTPPAPSKRPSKEVKAASTASQAPSFSTKKIAFLLLSVVSFATALVYARVKLW